MNHETRNHDTLVLLCIHLCQVFDITSQMNYLIWEGMHDILK